MTRTRHRAPTQQTALIDKAFDNNINPATTRSRRKKKKNPATTVIHRKKAGPEIVKKSRVLAA